MGPPYMSIRGASGALSMWYSGHGGDPWPLYHSCSVVSAKVPHQSPHGNSPPGFIVFCGEWPGTPCRGSRKPLKISGFSPFLDPSLGQIDWPNPHFSRFYSKCTILTHFDSFPENTRIDPGKRSVLSDFREKSVKMTS